MDFDTWMKEANEILTKWFGVDSRCLVDWCWRDAYEDNLTPRDAVECFIEDGVADGDLPDSYMEKMWEIQEMEDIDNNLKLQAN